MSVFAPDLHFDPKARGLVREYNRYSKNRSFGAFGPATYMAGLVALNAITKACANDQATRAEVTTFVRRTNIPSIFGGTVRFSRSGDPLPTRFVLYKVTNGKYSEVG